MNSITKLRPDWWVRVPEAERRFLRVLMGTIHEVEEQGPPETAGFAREWETEPGMFHQDEAEESAARGEKASPLSFLPLKIRKSTVPPTTSDVVYPLLR